MEEKLREIQNLMENAKIEMNYWNEITEDDNCIFNQSDFRRRVNMKRTLEHCSLITKYGKPDQADGKCSGYQKSREDDEPCEICKACKLNMFYEPDQA